MPFQETQKRTCTQCGAPLSYESSRYICKYCGKSYGEPVVSEPVPEYSDSILKKILKKITIKNVILVIVAILFINILCCVLPGFLGRNDTENLQSPEPQLEQSIYRKFYNSKELPAAFEKGDLISTGVVLSEANYRNIKIDIILQNTSEDVIDTNLKTDYIDIDLISVSDNLAHKYTCDISNTIVVNKKISPGEIIHAANIVCDENLNPMLKHLDIKYEINNRGNYSFQIPIGADINALQIKYQLILIKDTSFSIYLTFRSDPPQLVSFYKDELSFIDDRGNQYSPDGCIYLFDSIDSRSYYAQIATKNELDARSLQCMFNEPFPDDAHAITVILTTLGNTISATGTVDILNGMIEFSNQHSE